jgi:hypothetical protein
MNRRKITWLLFLMATALAFIFSRLSPVHDDRSTRIVVGRDMDDTQTATQQSSLKRESDDYFTKANPIPDHVK